MSDARITYTAQPGATPESERETLASIYAFVLRVHQERQKAAPSSRREEAAATYDVAADERSEV